MEAELDALEGKIVELVRISGVLREENHVLRQQLAEAQSETRVVLERLDIAADRIEQLIAQLPDDH